MKISERMRYNGSFPSFFSNDDASLAGYFTLAIKPITVYTEGLNMSKSMQRRLARVSEFDKENGTYTLSAYLIAQLGKNYKGGANLKITGQQRLQAAMDTIKEIGMYISGICRIAETPSLRKLLAHR